MSIEELLGKSQEEIASLPAKEQREILRLIEEYEHAKAVEDSRTNFLAFCKLMKPGFIAGAHHKIMAEKFERIVSGDLKRLIITMPPRHGKSWMASYLFPAWYLGHFPEHQIIQATHTAELAVDFGGDVRDLVKTKEYREVFPNTTLQADRAASGRWKTSKGGVYFAVGVGGASAGRGGNLICVDDAHSEQDGMRGDAATLKEAYDWFTSGPVQRAMPNAAMMVIMQRWHPADLVGQILKHQGEDGADQWEVVEFPVILPSGKPLWPEFFTIEELLGKKAIMAPHKWQSQYMQRPVARETSIISADMWKTWEGRDPPPCEIVIQAWDTAHDTKTKNDYSAMVTCGIFMHTDPESGETRPNIILLDAMKKRMQFPELKRTCLEEYRRSQPDSVVIEGRASGKSLVQELRSMGLPVTEFTVGRGTAQMPNDKISRVNSIADIFESGLVWAPETRFAQEVIEEVGAFPSGEHDDYVDCVCMILRRYRDGGFVRLDNDYEPEPLQRRRAAYY